MLGDASDALVARDAHGLATLGVDGVSLARDGRSVSAPEPDLTRLLGTAHANGLRAELLLSNYSNRLGDFDPAAAAKLLRDPAHVQAVAAQLASYVATQGWDGIQVDLESMAEKDADGLLVLVTDLQTRMAPEKTVSIAVMASTDPQEYVARGYRLAELGAAVDTFALMTYDQHGPGRGRARSGRWSWQRRAVGVVTAVVPAAKVDLGVAGYGYTWPRGREGRTVSASLARKLVARDGAKARWRQGARRVDGPTLRRHPDVVVGRPVLRAAARRWPPSWGCTASPCGGWARPTRFPSALRGGRRSAGRGAPPLRGRPRGVRRTAAPPRSARSRPRHRPRRRRPPPAARPEPRSSRA